MKVAAKSGSVYYEKVGGAENPQIPDYTKEDQVCLKSDQVNNVRSGKFSLGGGGHT